MPRTLTTEEFIAKAKSIHGDKCDYSKVQYVSSHSKVTIICPDHGPFEQRATGHLYGYGCPDCAIKARTIRQTKTTEQFIAKAKKVHGDKYDYSKVEYVNSKTKVTIICSDHGPFEQVPLNHYARAGCRECYDERQTKTTEEFIAKAKKVHGDKYDYSKVEYVNNKTKILITCPEHGDFLQTPSAHLQGRGCPRCGVEAHKKATTKTTEQFIAEAKEIHGDKYDYSKVEYLNAKAKVTIICSVHGPFEQRASSHLRGRTCLKCHHDAQRKTTEQFIAEARAVHGDRYDYSKVEYKNTDTRVCIICPDHKEFWQIPDFHLRLGTGCPTCGENLVSEPIFRKVLEEITSLKFPKKRPKWLTNPNTNSLLELDCYNKKSKIAFELQGMHHYEPVKFWRGEEGFQKTLQRDQIKKTICEEKGVHLFCIDQRPATSKTPQEKEEYYKKEIKKCLYSLPEDVIINIGVDDES